MGQDMNERTKKLQFSTKARNAIKERDGGCIFCQIGFKMPKFPLPATDIMHIVSRAQGGLGIEENGVLGCRYHHMMLDNGSGGERDEMMNYIYKYMAGKYPDWNEEKLHHTKTYKEEV